MQLPAASPPGYNKHMEELADKTIASHEELAGTLGGEEIKRLLGELANIWEIVDGEKIRREFEFESFREAMAFANKVAGIAEKKGHHPDMRISYARVTIEFSTHFVGGLTENDFIMAANVEKLA